MTLREFLLECGVFPNVKGFNCLIEAEKIVRQNPKIRAMELYAVVGKKFGDSAQKVERAIRSVVVDKIKIKQFNDIGINKRPTNGEFIWFFATEGGKR